MEHVDPQWHGVTHGLDELQASEPTFAGLRHVQDTTLVFLQVPPSA